jgi:photosystem II stability/assembly factor-like uncharacterized protein
VAKASLLFVGTDDGIVLFSNPGTVGRWLRIGQELRGQQVHAIWPSVDNPLVVLAALASGGLQRSEDGGQSWRSVFAGNLSSLVGHHSAAQALYLSTTDGAVYGSTDAGASWVPLAQDGRALGGAARLLVAAEDSQRLYLGDASGVWSSDDGGAHWAPYGVEVPRAVAALTAVPAQPGALYAVAESALYRCGGVATRWERLDATPDTSAALAILAGKDRVLLLARDAGLGRSADDGATWAPVGLDQPWNGGVTVITPAPYHIDTAFAGSGSGQLALSTDRGRTWQLLKQDLPAIRSIVTARLA